ncbi:UPF0182 family protein [Quadrisphaera sp. DSM 44207]|uniref:UPF0182 family membrane protein n=1 Tax=Quadrisphaera sp. DSM 44207 TaxID=1881057 RepID=UPI0008916F95|nr:UPF0182 family protein [Quadrisphaera sp. DSM 44207]SDQ08131.1 hypothetical protein SAMN05428996_0418 [Quadrisphaera sp. DSM 44207]
MTFQPPPRPSRPASAPARGGRRILLPTLLVVGAIVIGVSLLSQVGTEVLWYRQLGFDEVYTTRLLTQALLFLGAGLLMAGGVAASLSIAYRTRPVYAPVTQAAQNLDRYRESLEPLRRVVLVVLPAVLGLFAGSAAASAWQTVLLWLNATPFGTADPEFGLDVGFFVFTLPFLRFLLGLLTAVVLLSGLAGAATHYLYGGLRLQGPGPRTTRAARVHLSVLGGALVLLQAGSYWLDRYSTLTNSGTRFDGATYTDVHVVIPARAVLAIIALLCAVLFFLTAATGNWRFPVGGIALLVVSAIVGAGVLPALVQRFQVRPSEPTFEAPYIERNIEATRAAFDVGDVQTTPYTPEATAEAGALAEDAQTAASIRLLDPAIVSPTFRQLQQIRQYYGFPDALDVDRYDLGGETQDTVIAVRELDLAGLSDQNSWNNRHAIYTHGYGVVAAYGNQRSPNGEPAFFQQGIPSTGELGEYEPRIYFGERSPEFSIVGAPSEAAPRELDYPDDEAPSGQRNYTYQGEGGPSVGNLLTQLMYAVKFRDQNILLSDAVNPQSQILYDRSPRERVEKVAPFLTLDGDPYPAVVDGRVLWIVDGYTTSSAYPYSQDQVLGNVTADTVTQNASSVAALQQREVNYIRNSVKATVDAYSGEVTLYAWDEQDPVLASWRKVFPDAFAPVEEVDDALMAHLRYPEDLFKVQRAVLSSYHVTEPGAFYSRSDFWQVPDDPTAGNEVAQPPYYLTLQMPEQEAPSFSLSSTFIPEATQGNERNVLTGFLAVDADAGSTGGDPRDGYGQLRLLTLPRNTTVSGPGQVQNEFNANPTVSQELNLLRQGAAEVANGNLLTLPVGGGLLYVQPVYVESSGDTQVPLLQRVLVSFGGQIGFAETLDEALDQVFGGDSGAEAGDAGASGQDGAAPAPEPAAPPAEEAAPSPDATTPAPSPTTPAPAGSDLATALQEADQALRDGQDALSRGDFAAYGEAQDRLQAALQRALEAEAAAAQG